MILSPIRKVLFGRINLPDLLKIMHEGIHLQVDEYKPYTIVSLYPVYIFHYLFKISGLKDIINELMIYSNHRNMYNNYAVSLKSIQRQLIVFQLCVELLIIANVCLCVCSRNTGYTERARAIKLFSVYS